MALFRLAYGRVSSQEQNIELQIGQFERLGYDELFTEKISGRRRDRPEFDRLKKRSLQLRQEGHDVAIYVIEWTRWARDTAFALDSLKELESAGVQVVEVTTGEVVTLATASGFLATGMRSVMAQYYSAELAERILRSYDSRIHKGRGTSNRPPWGYQSRADKSWEPSDQWMIAREVIEKFISGEPINGLCRWLAETYGISRSRFGLLDWLKNPALRGHSRSRSELIYNTHTPLLSESEWKQVAARIEQNRRLRGVNKGKIHAVPAGLCRCDNCNRVMATKSNGVCRYFYCYYRHSLRDGSCEAPKSYCRDKWVEAAIQEKLLDAAEFVADQRLASDNTINPEVLKREQQIAGLKALPSSPAIESAIESIEAELVQINAGNQVSEIDVDERRELIEQLSQVTPEDWEELSKERRSSLYLALIETVRVSGKDVVEVILKAL